MKIVHKKIETLRENAIEANKFVREYFGIKSKKEPTVCIGVPWEEGIIEKEKAYYRNKRERNNYYEPSRLYKIKKKIQTLFTPSAYIWTSNKIYIFPSFLINMSVYNITPLLVHEMMHYHQRGTPLAIQNEMPRNRAEKLATDCALEGFAVFAEKEYKKQIKISERIKENVVKAVGAFLLFLASQAVLCAYVGAILFSVLPKPVKIKIAEIIDKHEKLAWFISWPYKEGHNFVKKLSEAIGTKNAFLLVCASPPTKFSEIVDADRYIQSRKTEIKTLLELNGNKT